MASLPLRKDFDAGRGRAVAARVGGMDRQPLRDRVHRFNEGGPEGLVNRARCPAHRRR